jgi:hypothetical protein
MAFDPATGQLLLFGGSSDPGTVLNDTWVWNGRTWSRLAPATSPPARTGSDLAYDAASRQLLLFGGADAAGEYLNDTWSWNGSNWVLLNPATSPPGRTHASLAYDTSTSQLILFGGVGASTSVGSDTWDWNGSNWSPLSPAASPPARSRGAMSYDPVTSQLLLFGGTSPSGQAMNDTWDWSGTTWSKLSPTVSPQARSSGVMVYDTAGAQTVLFGGVGSSATYLRDTWTWNGSDWIQLSPATSPPARCRAAAAFDPDSSQVVLFGGESSSTPYLRDTWAYTAVPASAPAAPTEAGAVTPGPGEVTVSFKRPVSDGGSPITSYTVTATDVTNPANGGQTATGSGSPITVTGLTDGDDYIFTVTAKNGVGSSAESAPSNVAVPIGPPTAPVMGNATRGYTQSTVTFKMPVSDGGSPITSYTVTATDVTNPANGGQTATGSGSPITVTGLADGDKYTFTVTATNAKGTGPPSAPSNTVVPGLTAPAAPTIGTAVVSGDATASVGFSAPVSDGGSPITSYTVTAIDSTNAANGGQTATGSESPITITGLIDGDDYTFTAAATNAVGTSAPSAPSNSVEPISPTITSVTPSTLARGSSGAIVTINGAGFEAPLSVTISGGSVTPSLESWGANQVTISVNVGPRAALGARDITVTIPNGSVTCSHCLTITRAPPSQRPAISSRSLFTALRASRRTHFDDVEL